MKKKDLLYLLLTLAIIGILLFLFIYSPNNQDKFIISDISVEINGKIKKKVEVRENLLTHALIERYNKADTLIFLGENIDSVNIEDYFLKHKDSPFFYTSKQGESPKKFKYVSIPKSILNNKDFPKAWKDSCKTTWKSVIVN